MVPDVCPIGQRMVLIGGTGEDSGMVSHSSAKRSEAVTFEFWIAIGEEREKDFFFQIED